MTFRELIRFLADRVGHHHIPMRDDADDISELLGADGIHHELVHGIVRSIYRANRCGYLDAQVDTFATFSALGEIRGDILRSPKTDIDQVNFINRLDTAVASVFVSDAHTKSSLDAPTHPDQARSTETTTASVRSFATIRK